MNTRKTAVLLGLAATLAACSNDITTPASQLPSGVAEVEGSMQDLSGTDTIKFSITINPSTTTYFYLGAGNSLTFPANSLCALGSSYGPSEWDKPCTKATSPVTINVKAWLNNKGKPQVDFDKHVRFVPSTNPAQWVVITFADWQAAMDPFFNILYCPGTGGCYDESKSDLSLLTTRNPLTGKVTRRIKHFSGYNVAAGSEGLFNLGSSFSVSPADVELETVQDVQMAYPRMTGDQAEEMLHRVREAKRSGYILASG